MLRSGRLILRTSQRPVNEFSADPVVLIPEHSVFTRPERHVCCAGTESFILIRSSGSNSAVECDLAKVEVAGSIPVSRSSFFEALRMRGLFVLAYRFTELSGAVAKW